MPLRILVQRPRDSLSGDLSAAKASAWPGGWGGSDPGTGYVPLFGQLQPGGTDRHGLFIYRHWLGCWSHSE